MLILFAELIFVLAYLAFISFYITIEKDHLTILGQKIPPVVLSLVSILIGILLTLPVVIKLKYNHHKRIGDQKKKIKELKKTEPQITKLLTDDK